MKNSSVKNKGKKTNKSKKGSTPRVVKVCPLCEKPHKMRTQLCSVCNKRAKDLSAVVPQYIIKEMKRQPLKEFITISGDKCNPNIHYICKVCKEEQVQKFDDLRTGRGHNCIKTKSSGEVIVENYLKSRYRIRTQFHTLRCINPITGKQMPYDIELPDFKVLIEIQGEQHLKFIPYFHGSIENFYYQQKKDQYKKEYAERCGCRLIYIYYDEIRDGSYMSKLNFNIHY